MMPRRPIVRPSASRMGAAELSTMRVLPSARRFRELDASGAEVVPELEPVDVDARRPQAGELVEEASPRGGDGK